jgi:AmmeMemoRadiSam system protein B
MANGMNVKLRPLKTQPTVQNGQRGILLTDPLGISTQVLYIPEGLTLLLELMDGTRNAATLSTGFTLRSGQTLPQHIIEQFITQLDNGLFLDNERFKKAYELALDEYKRTKYRKPKLAGQMYAEDPIELEKQFEGLFKDAGTEDVTSISSLRGIISPHIDFQRGKEVYSEVWQKAQKLIDSDFEIIILLGTDHNASEGKITLTYQNYSTPWGILPTNQEIVKYIAESLGEESFKEELNHANEHSIETVLVWLHFILKKKPYPIVPILCGSFDTFFNDATKFLNSPITMVVERLKEVTKSHKSLIVAAADLSHMGPVFGDRYPLDFAGRANIVKQDKKLIEIISQGSYSELFKTLAGEKNASHVCGLPPIYILLSVLDDVVGIQAGYSVCPASQDSTSVVTVFGMLFGDREG